MSSNNMIRKVGNLPEGLKKYFVDFLAIDFSVIPKKSFLFVLLIEQLPGGYSLFWLVPATSLRLECTQ